jgi:hypothetical protein
VHRLLRRLVVVFQIGSFGRHVILL